VSGEGRTGTSAGLATTPGTSAPKQEPLDAIHALRRKESEHTYDKYKEAGTTSTTLAGIEARRTRYTYSESGALIGKPFVGALYTAISGERGILVNYRCPASEEKTLIPVFAKMAASVKVGTGGGT
jgi:hypothetical protein